MGGYIRCLVCGWDISVAGVRSLILTPCGDGGQERSSDRLHLHRTTILRPFLNKTEDTHFGHTRLVYLSKKAPSWVNELQSLILRSYFYPTLSQLKIIVFGLAWWAGLSANTDWLTKWVTQSMLGPPGPDRRTPETAAVSDTSLPLSRFMTESVWMDTLGDSIALSWLSTNGYIVSLPFGAWTSQSLGYDSIVAAFYTVNLLLHNNLWFHWNVWPSGVCLIFWIKLEINC